MKNCSPVSIIPVITLFLGPVITFFFLPDVILWTLNVHVYVFFCRFFFKLVILYPTVSTLFLFKLSFHCHFAFPSILVFFFFFLSYVFILFTFLILLSSYLKCLLVLFPAVSRGSTVFLLWFEERKVLETPKKQEVSLQNTLLYLSIELIQFCADDDCSVPWAHRSSERHCTWDVPRMELLRSSLDQAWTSSGIFLRPIVKPSGGSS